MKKLLALATYLIATSAMAQQATVFNKSQDYDQVLNYEIGYYSNVTSTYVPLVDSTIKVSPHKYATISFPLIPEGSTPMMKIMSAQEDNTAFGKYSGGKLDMCFSDSGADIAFILDDLGSPLITCTVTYYLNDI